VPRALQQRSPLCPLSQSGLCPKSARVSLKNVKTREEQENLENLSDCARLCDHARAVEGERTKSNGKQAVPFKTNIESAGCGHDQQRGACLPAMVAQTSQ